MNIDFIKWKVGYAEGFSWNQFGFGINIPERAYSVTPKEFEQDKLMYSLLLQRAIEGINKEELYGVFQDDGYIKIRSSNNRIQQYYSVNDSVDHAKEQALKYIYEQELPK